MKHFTILTFFLYFQWAFAQHPAFYQINDERGLPSNEVYKIVQDDFGYIWMGCDAGLFRYDGFNYKHFSNSKQNARGISFLQIDNKQRVWCKNFYGQIYRVEGDSLKIIKYFKTSSPSYPQFAIDKNCNLWTYDKNKLICYNENGDSLKSFDIKNHCEQIIALKFFNGQLYLFFKDLSIVKFNLKTETHQHLISNLNQVVSTQNCMVIEHQNRLIMLVESNVLINKFKLYKMEADTIDSFYDFVLTDKDERIFSIFSDNEELWATSSSGAFKINKLEKPLFEKEKISSMLIDREGQYWFSTLQSGLFVAPQINVLKYDPGNSALTDNNLVTLRAYDKKYLLIGSYLGNVFEFNPESNSIEEHFKNKNGHFISVKSIERNNQYTIISRGRFCVIKNTTGKQFFPGISNIRDVALLGDTVYLIHSGFVAKLSLIEMTKKSAVNYLYLKKIGGKAIEYDLKNKTMYVLLGDGFYSIDSDGKWLELFDENQKIQGSSLCYENGVVWLAGISSGVYGFENKKIKYHFKDKNVLKENSVRTIKADSIEFWVCTDNYLHRINLITKEVGIFNTSQSINPKDINAIEFLGQNVYLATNRGLLSFPKQFNWKNNVAPNISISGVSINDSLLDNAKNISLPFDNNSLKISFSSVALKSKGNYYYQYRLFGLDSNWISINASVPFSLFSHIPAGDFIFQVKAINEHGVASEIKSINIHVKSPVWQHWWFYLILTVLGSVAVSIVYIWRISFIKRRAELKSKVIASQLTALKSQMNPHFMFNALNSIQDLVLLRDVKNSNLYISKFSSLMRKVLEASGLEKIALQDEIDILALYLDLEKLRFGDEFQFEILIDKQIGTDDLFIPSMILQPFVENAIKHGLLHKKNQKLLHIEFSLSTILICTITDNGIGRKHSAEIKKRQNDTHVSFATQAIIERFELLNSYSNRHYGFEIIDLFDNENPIGTKVLIKIPY